MKIEELAGKSLMFGVPGSCLDPEICRHLQETYAAGLIFFRPNFESAEKFTELIAGLENSCGRRFLTAVDHEGGRVIHLAEGITVFPDNLAVGNAGKPEWAAAQGRIEALELRRLGICLNLAPTVDVLTENFSPNIGIRSYGRNADHVSTFSAARIQAMQQNGLSACAKHFPGQGQSPLDAHESLPVLPTSWEELRSIHLKPFTAAIKAGVDTVMSSHPVYPKLDPSGVPATFSRKIVYELLRLELGYDGVILSDDLEMGALRGLCTLGESAVRALEAGHDMVLVCHDVSGQKEVYKAVLEALKSGRLELKEREASAARIDRLLHKRSKTFEGGPPRTEHEGFDLAYAMAKQGLRAIHEEKFNEACAAETSSLEKIQVFFPRLSGLGDRVFIEPEVRDEKSMLLKIFQTAGFQKPEIKLYEIGEAPPFSLTHFESDSLVIFFCYDAHYHAAEKEMLEKLNGLGKAACAVLLRDPYDEAWVKAPVLGLIPSGFRQVQVRAAVEKLVEILKPIRMQVSTSLEHKI